MHSEVGWVPVFSGTQVQPQIILKPGYLPDYLSVSYDNESLNYNLFFKKMNTRSMTKNTAVSFVSFLPVTSKICINM